MRGALYDELNKFMDTANHNLFHTYGLLQTQFDAVIASIWLYWRPTSLFANSRGFVSARCVINYFSKVLKKIFISSENRTELTDCIASFDDVIAKLINHLQNEVMRPIFDVRHSGMKMIVLKNEF